MRNIFTDLENILHHIKQVSQSNLSNQQLIFVTHIEKTAQTLLDSKLYYMPQTEYHHMHILPSLGDELIQPITAIYGYAKLLLDSPASFYGAKISDSQRPMLEAIYQIGRNLETYINAINQKANKYRQTARQQPPQIIDLRQFIYKHKIIYEYWLRQIKKSLLTFIDEEDYPIFVNSYHLNAIFQHCIVTPYIELHGNFSGPRLYIQNSYNYIQVVINCSSMAFSDNNMRILFQHNGRETYLTQLKNMNAQIHIPPKSTSTLVLIFPRVAL